jgi:hypothetical protein
LHDNAATNAVATLSNFRKISHPQWFRIGALVARKALPHSGTGTPESACEMLV